MASYSVAIVGATGMVGKEFIKVLQQRRFPISRLTLLASDRSAGTTVEVNGERLRVLETQDDSFAGVDLALFSAGTDISLHFGPIAARGGAVVIDNSAAFRMDSAVPLVVPEINPGDIPGHAGIIANPNCSTIQMVVALNPLHQVNPLRRVTVSTYQAVSGTGAAAVEELQLQSRQVLDGEPTDPKVYPYQIAFNVLPEIDVFLPNGYTREEWKMVEETRKIMHLPDLPLSATTVRVPVLAGHSEALSVEFQRPFPPEEARRVLQQAPGVAVVDDPARRLYPHAWAAAGQDDVFVGRIRQDVSCPAGLVMWVVADNLRKGAALNAVQIAETMVQRGWL